MAFSETSNKFIKRSQIKKKDFANWKAFETIKPGGASFYNRANNIFERAISNLSAAPPPHGLNQ